MADQGVCEDQLALKNGLLVQLGTAAFSANYDLDQLDRLSRARVTRPGKEYFDYVLDHNFQDLRQILRILAPVLRDDVAESLQVVILQGVDDLFEEHAEVVVRQAWMNQQRQKRGDLDGLAFPKECTDEGLARLPVDLMLVLIKAWRQLEDAVNNDLSEIVVDLSVLEVFVENGVGLGVARSLCLHDHLLYSNNGNDLFDHISVLIIYLASDFSVFLHDPGNQFGCGVFAIVGTGELARFSQGHYSLDLDPEHDQHFQGLCSLLLVLAVAKEVLDLPLDLVLELIDESWIDLGLNLLHKRLSILSGGASCRSEQGLHHFVERTHRELCRRTS